VRALGKLSTIRGERWNRKQDPTATVARRDGLPRRISVKRYVMMDPAQMLHCPYHARRDDVRGRFTDARNIAIAVIWINPRDQVSCQSDFRRIDRAEATGQDARALSPLIRPLSYRARSSHDAEPFQRIEARIFLSGSKYRDGRRNCRLATQFLSLTRPSCSKPTTYRRGEMRIRSRRGPLLALKYEEVPQWKSDVGGARRAGQD